MSKYFVIHNSDGDATVTEFTKEQLIAALNERYWGKCEYLTEIPGNDTNYWGGAVLILKGDIADIKPVNVVKEFTVV